MPGQELEMSRVSSAGNDSGQSVLSCRTDVGCTWMTGFGECDANKTDLGGVSTCLCSFA